MQVGRGSPAHASRAEPLYSAFGRKPGTRSGQCPDIAMSRLSWSSFARSPPDRRYSAKYSNPGVGRLRQTAIDQRPAPTTPNDRCHEFASRACCSSSMPSARRVARDHQMERWTAGSPPLPGGPPPRASGDRTCKAAGPSPRGGHARERRVTAIRFGRIVVPRLGLRVRTTWSSQTVESAGGDPVPRFRGG
jgi:hypothetical protein